MESELIILIGSDSTFVYMKYISYLRSSLYLAYTINICYNAPLILVISLNQVQIMKYKW